MSFQLVDPERKFVSYNRYGTVPVKFLNNDGERLPNSAKKTNIKL
jgi:hypothetical protein